MKNLTAGRKNNIAVKISGQNDTNALQVYACGDHPISLIGPILSQILEGPAELYSFLSFLLIMTEPNTSYKYGYEEFDYGAKK